MMRILSSALTLVLAACSGGGGSSAPPPSPIPTGTLELFAGAASGPGNADGVGATARFNVPAGLAVDAGGNIYVADSNNAAIRKIDPAHSVTTVAGTALQRGNVDASRAEARFSRPVAVAVDRAGNIFVADSDNSNIRKITPAGAVTTLAGAREAGSVDGPGTAARFLQPRGVAVDGIGNVYVADTLNFTIRKIAPDGMVSTLAGAAGEAGSIDASGSAARFGMPEALAVDIAGNVYVADGVNSTIRKVSPAGVVSTFAGRPGVLGNANGPVSDATFRSPYGIAIDAIGNIYVIDSSGGFEEVRKITPQGIVTTLFSSLGYGAGIAVSQNGTVFVTDASNHAIQELSPSGVITIAGSSSNLGPFDGVGAQARFQYAQAIAIDNQKNIYVADVDRLRKVTLAAQVTTVGSLSLIALATDSAGAVFASYANCVVYPRGVQPPCVGAIRRVSPQGAVTVITPSTNGDGTGLAIEYPTGLAIDAAGNFYVADRNQAVIRKMTAAGDISTLAGAAHVLGSADGAGRFARFSAPTAVAVDPSGNLLVADGNAIRRVTPSGDVTTLAGSALAGSVDGIGAAARFNTPNGIALDEQGSLYVADTGNHTIRKVTPAGVVTTVAGTPGINGFQPGPLPGVLSFPAGVAVSDRDLYITTSAVLAVVRDRP